MANEQDGNNPKKPRNPSKTPLERLFGKDAHDRAKAQQEWQNDFANPQLEPKGSNGRG